jgi:enterochelin esterase-like enzyme
VLGCIGAARYLDNFWLYRGYSPPADPSYVKAKGRTEVLRVRSAALGGRAQRVYVYLPPGYGTEPGRRYAVLYLLHGVPGQPDSFLRIVRTGVIDDELVATGQASPLIVVMPSGSTGMFTDKEWANGIHPREGWETFVARDLVRTIDARYRTVRSGAGRALAGLSEGGYGALNIGLHHPGEFRVLESWSGYERADDVDSVFGDNAALIAYNSPLERVGRVVGRLRRARTFIWFYSSSRDRLLAENDSFAAAVSRARLPHRYLILPGGHDWRLWRKMARPAILAAEHHLLGGVNG